MKHNMITIKGTSKGLTIHIDTQADTPSLVQSLQTYLAQAKGFFNGAIYVFNASPEPLTLEQEEQLNNICLAHGLRPAPKHQCKPTEEAQKSISRTSSSPEEGLTFPFGLNEKELASTGSLLIKSLRSGEKLARKGHIILVGDVNPGSEIIASGNIVVMGTIKGTVHAGAEGDKQAFVIASILDPIQIRIAHLIALNPEKSVIKKHTPEIARVVNDTIVIDTYKTRSLT